MPTLQELLLAKNKRLQAVPDRFISTLAKVQQQLIDEVLVLLTQFEVDNTGAFAVNKKNLLLAADIDIKLRDALERSEYTEAVTAFAGEFNTQVEYNDDYFREAFPNFTASTIGRQAVLNAQRTAVQLLVNTSADANFIMPIKQAIEQAVVNSATFKETIGVLRTLVVGNEEVEGKIMHYAKQIAHDSYAVGDAAYAAIMAEEHGAQWYRYSGSEIETTRPFCAERDGGYYCKFEIQQWGAGKKTGKPREFAWPQALTWAGRMQGTDSSTIFSTRGGYNCRHSIMGISIFKVPKADILRAIELGYYKPTPFEVKELGLPTGKKEE
jgi:predicted nucleic acid-binding protein